VAHFFSGTWLTILLTIANEFLAHFVFTPLYGLNQRKLQ